MKPDEFARSGEIHMVSGAKVISAKIRPASSSVKARNSSCLTCSNAAVVLHHCSIQARFCAVSSRSIATRTSRQPPPTHPPRSRPGSFRRGNKRVFPDEISLLAAHYRYGWFRHGVCQSQRRLRSHVQPRFYSTEQILGDPVGQKIVQWRFGHFFDDQPPDQFRTSGHRPQFRQVFIVRDRSARNTLPHFR